eukprot:COSAG02_NODE_12949_length_1468_cov_1.470416_2_plen_22_part_01
MVLLEAPPLLAESAEAVAVTLC